MKNKQSLHIIDGNNLLYAGYYAYKRLNIKHQDNTFTNNIHMQGVDKLSKASRSSIYGFPVMLAKVIKDLNPSHVIIAWDAKGKCKERVNLLPNYKGHRKKDTMDYDNFLYQKSVVIKLMYALGIPQIYKDGIEADDWVYSIIKELPKEQKVVIVSRDKDFFQLINKQVKCYDRQQVHVKGLISKKSLKNPVPYRGSSPPNYGYYPRQCVDYLTLVGDSSDDIPGYSGIGHKRALDFLDKYSSIKEFLNSEHTHSIIDKEILAKLSKLNKKLIDLKVFNKLYMQNQKLAFYKDAKDIKYRPKLFAKLCDKFSLNTFKVKHFTKTFKDLGTWENLLNQ